MKKTLLIAILLFAFAFTLSALEAEITWVWFENDPDVQYYRYQIDGEDEDKWTVVDFFVNEVTVTLDVSVMHTLYLQQSYDGILWSESSFTESDVYIEAEKEEDFFEDDLFDDVVQPEPAEETPQEPVEVEDEVVMAEVIEDEIQLPEVEVEKGYDPLASLDFGIGYMDSLPDSAGPKTVGLNVSYSRTFFKAGIFDIGAKADIGIYTSKDLFSFRKWSSGEWKNSWQLLGYGNAMALASARVGNCDLYGALGIDAGITLVKDRSAVAGLGIEFGVRYHRFEKISIGFAVADHYYFLKYDNRDLSVAISNRFELKAFMGLSF